MINQLSKHIVVNGVIQSPRFITQNLLDYCLNVTSLSRQFMEQNPKSPLAHDYIGFPGKMDHATCITVTVGNFDPKIEETITNTLKPPNPNIWPF